MTVGPGGVGIGGNNAGNINTGEQTIINTGGGPAYLGHAAKPPPPAPFQAPLPAADHVPRARETALLMQHVLGVDGQLQPVTLGLHGFGGAGKTTLARLLCANAAVRNACVDGILWVPVGKNPPDARAQMADLVTALAGECNGCATLAGARAQLLAALAPRKALLVVDDVWDEAHIKDLLEASAGCARLITTRNTQTLPFEAVLVDVRTMQIDEARQLLGAGLPVGEEARLARLASRLGHWPVLLRLSNRALRQRVLRQHMPLAKALDAVGSDLAQKGVLAFDPGRDVVERDQAVAATVEASLELLDPAERRCCAELAIFPQDVPVPVEQAAALWGLTAGLDADQTEDLIASRLEPLSLIDYDGALGRIRLHDVLRKYLLATLADRGLLHRRLAEHWGDTPMQGNAYAWRWLAFHVSRAAMSSDQPTRHAMTRSVVELVGNASWQQSHERAIADVPALGDALSWALEAAVIDDDRLGVALIVQAADALMQFRRDRLRPEPVFELARRGDLGGARGRAGLFSVDDHWRQALLLMMAWLAPLPQRDQSRELVEAVQAELGSQHTLGDLLLWIRADLWGEPAADFAYQVAPPVADEALVEELLKRVGGGQYNRELIRSRGLDPLAHDPDRPPPTRGLVRESLPGATDADDERTTTRYLAELDGPYLVAYAAQDPVKGTVALDRYLSVHTNYSYAEYRFSTLWILLGFVVQFPRKDGGAWVKDAVLRILTSALSGTSVEFEQGLTVAVTALRASALDPAAHQALTHQARVLIGDTAHIKPGRDREGSDIWAHHKRMLLAQAQAHGWLLGDGVLAGQLLQEAESLADSGFAGYQAPGCLAMAEAMWVCAQGGVQFAAQIEQSLTWAQSAAHNVQDPTFCARMTARVNAMRRHWWKGFGLDDRALHLDEAAYRPEFNALHLVGHQYIGRRSDALELPAWATDDSSFDALNRLYQRSKADFLRLNGGDRALQQGDELAVPDPGLVPHLAARLSAEVLAQSGQADLSARHMQLLRTLVPFAVLSPTALDSVLTRLVMAQGRRGTPVDMAEVQALEAVLARRPEVRAEGVSSELLATRMHGRLPA